MLRRADAIGVVGIVFILLGLFCFVAGRADPAHANIWRDWLLAIVLWITGCAMVIGWSLYRLFSTASEHDLRTKSKTARGASAGSGR